MLEKLFPRFHARYRALPVLGPSLESLATYLVDLGFTGRPLVRHIRTAGHIDRLLRAQGCRELGDVFRDRLRSCVHGSGNDRQKACLASTVRLLERHLEDIGVLAPVPTLAQDSRLTHYTAFLRHTRGLAESTIAAHLLTARALLTFGDTLIPSPTAALTQELLERFVESTARRVGRATMQHVVAQLRGFLRFLALRGEAPPELATRIDTPRVYRGEKLPRSLPWETVEAFLRSIDRSTAMGRRDFAMFSLIATYGLRSAEVVALCLEDIEWRSGRLRVAQQKTRQPLWLPLTDEVGGSLIAYLRDGRPEVPFREVFVRHRAPTGILKPTAVAEAFQGRARRSGLAIPFKGAHCLRHSFAVHLLRQGTSLKTIGDILGHRSAESTCVYLRLAVEDLRGVALSLPTCSLREVHS